MILIKALLFTILLFAIAFALASLPVLFGGIGAIVMLAIIFLMIFLRFYLAYKAVIKCQRNYLTA